MLEIVYHTHTKIQRKKDTKSKADYSQTPYYRTGSAKINYGVVQGEIEIYTNKNPRIDAVIKHPLVHTWGPSIFSFVGW
jgi:hypothetical protein